MNAHVARAQFLLSQQRYEQAEQEIGRALAQDPEDAHLHAMLAICLAERGQHPRAVEEGRLAVHHGPDVGYAHFAHGFALQAAARLPEAEAALRCAVQFEPADADCRGLLGVTLMRQSRWREALAAADDGLALDPEHGTCTNVRAMALRQMGRRAESGQTIAGALQRDPDDPLSHANLGWTKLHAGAHREALEHFREALRLDPNLEFAREGMVEALRARYFLYRILLRYFLWMSRLSDKAQLGVILGLFLLQRVLRGAAHANPELQPYVTPILVLYFVFFVSTWIAPALFDLILRTSPFGRHALTIHQVRASNVLLCMTLAAGACLAIGFLLDRGAWVITAFVPGLLAMPLVNSLRLAHRVHRRHTLLATAALALIGAVAVVLRFIDPALASGALGLFFLAFLANAFLSSWLASRPVPDE